MVCTVREGQGVEMTRRGKKDIKRQCGTCKFWQNTYKGSRIVNHSVGTCECDFNWNTVPYALQLGMKGWFAVDRQDGEECPTWKAK